MRIATRNADKFPQLGAAVEGMAALVASNPRIRAALDEACAGDLERLNHALGYPTNPWVTIEDPDSLEGSDPRGHFGTARPNTIVISKTLALALEEGGDAALKSITITVLRGLVHWVHRKEWADPDQEPGRSFEAVNFAGQVTVTTHDAPNNSAPPADPTDVTLNEETPIVFRLGASILDVAKRHLGQQYAFSPTPDYDDPNWPGPFDCAEFASYCAWCAYGIAYGVNKDPEKRFNSYSGYWKRDAAKFGLRIAWRDALHIPGAILLRHPPRGGPPPFGHVAISLGNGGGTYEAHSSARGVCEHTARHRSWHGGVLLPGVLYDLPDGLGSDLLVFKLMDPPAGYSPIVERAQEKLVELGLLASQRVNGVYDETTSSAIADFQDDRGLVVDGELGPETGRTLGLEEIWVDASDGAPSAFASAPPAEETAIDAEVLTLARTLYGEARGEPREGQEAVANVILNRVRSPRYPNTVSKVCLQRWQFSCWNENDPNRHVIEALRPGANAAFDVLLAIAADAVFGRLPRRVPEVLHYHASHISRPNWVRKSPGATLVKTIGQHLFWRGIR